MLGQLIIQSMDTFTLHDSVMNEQKHSHRFIIVSFYFPHVNTDVSFGLVTNSEYGSQSLNGSKLLLGSDGLSECVRG